MPPVSSKQLLKRRSGCGDYDETGIFIHFLRPEPKEARLQLYFYPGYLSLSLHMNTYIYIYVKEYMRLYKHGCILMHNKFSRLP